MGLSIYQNIPLSIYQNIPLSIYQNNQLSLRFNQSIKTFKTLSINQSSINLSSILQQPIKNIILQLTSIKTSYISCLDPTIKTSFFLYLVICQFLCYPFFHSFKTSVSSKTHNILVHLLFQIYINQIDSIYNHFMKSRSMKKKEEKESNKKKLPMFP